MNTNSLMLQKNNNYKKLLEVIPLIIVVIGFIEIGNRLGLFIQIPMWPILAIVIVTASVSGVKTGLINAIIGSTYILYINLNSKGSYILTALEVIIEIMILLLIAIWLGKKKEENLRLKILLRKSQLIVEQAEKEELLTTVKGRQVALQDTSSRLTTLLENLEGGIVVYDNTKRVILINQAFCDIFDIPVLEPTLLIGADFSNFAEEYQRLFAEPEEFICRYKEIIAYNERVSSEELHFADGRVFERDYVPICLGEKYEGNLWIYRDISDRKKAEVELRNTLEKEKELNELKSRFVTMTSHEFRTPLTTILGAAEILKYYGEDMNQEEILKYLDRIHITVEHLTRMLDDILLLGKAESGKLEFSPAPLDLVEFCYGLVEELRVSTQNQDQIIFFHQVSEISGNMDEKLLRHIFMNLLTNGIKYSPVNSIINFDLFCQNGEATFIVKDQGCGIPLEDQARLFEPFHRGNNVNKIQGTGLGLTIVKKSVDLHGGTIDFKSKVGVGTTFKVTLPLDVNLKKQKALEKNNFIMNEISSSETQTDEKDSNY